MCETSRTPPFRQAWLVPAALILALVMQPKTVTAATLAAWVQLVGPGRDASIRVITDAPRCPTIKANGEDLPMQVRAAPGPLFRPGSNIPPASFEVLACEVMAPPGTSSILLDGNPLPLPAPEIRRIVAFGDTGCRINEKKKKQQDCANDWPYQKIARRAAAAHPDLVIHVGDYLYRESCDSSKTDCSRTPTGYGWEEWRDDFFKPSAPLLAAAPWIMVRGNHETCSRAGEGWFRFLDPARPTDECIPMIDPFVVALGAIGFVVLDSGQIAKEKASDNSADDDDDDDDDDDVADTGDPDDTVAALRRAYAKISDHIPSSAWILTHAPFNAVKSDKNGGDEIVNTVQQRALGDQLPKDIEMIVSGHVHTFEALSFADTNPPKPPQLVVGTGGVKLAKKPKEPDEVAGVPVSDALILKRFAYMVWDRDGASWRGVLFDQDGAQLARCRLADRQLACRE